MILHKTTGTVYKSRLDAKLALGGNVPFNKAYKNKEFIFLTNEDIIKYVSIGE